MIPSRGSSYRCSPSPVRFLQFLYLLSVVCAFYMFFFTILPLLFSFLQRVFVFYRCLLSVMFDLRVFSCLILCFVFVDLFVVLWFVVVFLLFMLFSYIVSCFCSDS